MLIWYGKDKNENYQEVSKILGGNQEAKKTLQHKSSCQGHGKFPHHQPHMILHDIIGTRISQ